MTYLITLIKREPAWSALYALIGLAVVVGLILLAPVDPVMAFGGAAALTFGFGSWAIFGLFTHLLLRNA